MRLFSIGHGARSFEELVRTLAAGSVELLVDVRSFPGSRRHPQFGREVLAEALPGAGVRYHWQPALGGRRRLAPGTSPNPAWRVEAFRAYADYMDSGEFARGLDELLALAAVRPTAFMCAETHWSRCHRRLIADKLWSLGHEVIHLITPERSEAHQPPTFLRLDGEHLRYDLAEATYFDGRPRTREHARRDYEKGQSRVRKKKSTRRVKAVERALEREGHKAVSRTSLSRQARAAASRRSAAERSAAARKAARTRSRRAG